ncbi:hypothetical protein AB0178_22340, partial [Klebsiella pneumoniae]
GKNSLNRLIRCVCGKKIGPDPRNFNQRVSLGRNDLLIRTFPNIPGENGGFSRHSAFFIYSLSFLPVLMKKAQVFANIVPGDNR